MLDAENLRGLTAEIVSAYDLLPDLKSASNGYVVDKVEGFTIDAAGDAFVVTDNDGVDGFSGETLFLRLGPIATVN